MMRPQHRGIDLPQAPVGRLGSYPGVPKTDDRAARQAFLEWVSRGIAAEFHKAVLAGILTETGVARVKELFPQIVADEVLRNSTGISQENSWINCCGTVSSIPVSNSPQRSAVEFRTDIYPKF